MVKIGLALALGYTKDDHFGITVKKQSPTIH